MNEPAAQFLPFMFSMILVVAILVILWQVTKRVIPAFSTICFYLALIAGLILLATPVLVGLYFVARDLFGKFLPYLIFYALSLLILFSAFSAATRKNLVHAALFLCLMFLGVSGIFILQNAEFLAAVQILVYAGAITVLMLFAIMLTQNLAGHELKAFNRQVPFVLLAVGLLAILMVFIFLRPVTIDENTAFSAHQKWAVQVGVEDMAIEIPNITLIGQSLMSTYTLAFWIASIILTIAMIGGLILARKD